MWFYWWKPLIVSHHNATSGGHRHCQSRGMMLSVVGEDSKFPHLNPPSLFLSKAHGMPCLHARNFRTVTIICWCIQRRTPDPGHTRITDRNYLKSFCQSVQKQWWKGKGEEKTRMAIAKLFALHAHAIESIIKFIVCIMTKSSFYKNIKYHQICSLILCLWKTSFLN